MNRYRLAALWTRFRQRWLCHHETLLADKQRLVDATAFILRMWSLRCARCGRIWMVHRHELPAPRPTIPTPVATIPPRPEAAK